ncbi:peptidoglycan-binding protein [Streptomyces sp. NPDC059499]|uniref:peptidoglycan-binding domain-containing protein n=1 Tax=Streptomyces sp. NPDC059499 TaxID=3346852 RepID=UPI00368EE8EE
MGKFKTRLLGSAAAAVVLGAGLVTLTATPAAALGTCTSAITITTSSGADTTAIVPGLSSGVSWNPGECQLAKGNSGAGVKAMQRGLNACYGAGLTADGIFGDKTRTALIAAQNRVGVSADGIFGPKTRQALYWMVYNDEGPLNCRYVPRA